ncbi:Uncharacterised protein [Escherichia coli]|uniref:Uncharacterized protein n=1 Tax=Escherichia coli TaxID=562 RepID=A0A2X3K6F9_ECOLX|nr:Uncharacterised protein [Escherichia coli]
MDDQLKQSALDSMNFQFQGKSRFLQPSLWQRSAIWRWPTHQALPHLVLKSKKTR